MHIRVDDLISALFITTPPTLFNQYCDWDPILDQAYAGVYRTRNLLEYINQVQVCKVLLVGEAAGYRGCRFSGIPFCGENLFTRPGFPVQGWQTSLHGPYSENSGTIFWRVLLKYFPYFFSWNTVPYHPYCVDNPLSNRTPTTQEIELCKPILQLVVEMAQPKQIVAIGNIAKATLDDLGFGSIRVRHPAHGGAKKFEEGITEVFSTFTGS